MLIKTSEEEFIRRKLKKSAKEWLAKKYPTCEIERNIAKSAPVIINHRRDALA